MDCLIACFTCTSPSIQDVTKDQIHADYQEIKVQECTGVLAIGSVPRALPCILKHELVDSCRAGEEVLITGILGVRSRRTSATLKEGVKMDGELFLLASSVLPFSCTNNHRHKQHRNQQQQQQQPVVGHSAVSVSETLWLSITGGEHERIALRDRIVRSFCPGIHGMFLVKLAVLLTVIGGGSVDVDASGPGAAAAAANDGIEAAANKEGHRREGHILLVGDPGKELPLLLLRQLILDFLPLFASLFVSLLLSRRNR